MTAKLILTLDGAILREYPVAKDSVSVGRRHGNDIQIDDLTVSGRHALVTTLVGNTYVEDLASTNGTLVNGRRVRKLKLHHGDVIQLGTHQLTYFEDARAAYQPTMFIKAEISDTQMIDTAPSAGDEIGGMPLGAVRILNGPLTKKVLELRRPFNTLGFKGIKMAMITRSNLGYVVLAVKSHRGRRATDIPMLNGAPLGGEARQLKEHDIIEVAGFQMEFVYLR